MFALFCEQGSEYWERVRKHNNKISSTQVAAVLSCSKYKSKTLVWKEFFGYKKPSEFVSPAMAMGRREERNTLKECLDTLKITEKVYFIGVCHAIDPTEPFSCSPDGCFVSKETGCLVGIEIKNTENRDPPQKKEDIPLDHLFQCFTCLNVTKAEYWILFTKCQNSGLTSAFKICPNPEAWEEIKALAIEFVNSSNKACPTRRSAKDNEISSRIVSKILLFCTKYNDDSKYQ